MGYYDVRRFISPSQHPQKVLQAQFAPYVHTEAQILIQLLFISLNFDM